MISEIVTNFDNVLLRTHCRYQARICQLLRDRMKENQIIDLSAPKIRLTRDKAEVQAKSTIRGNTVDWTMHTM